MDKKYQVFISSTYVDLKDQRDAVVKAVLKMGHLPVGMEMFNAADQQQWDVIKRHIDNSDFYVLIVANRYGSSGPAGIGYTEQEYEYALEQKVPCLGFLLQKGTLWPDTMVETGPAKKRLDAFKKKVSSRPVNFWDSTDNLALQVYASLSEAITLTDRPGWVRATEAASPRVAEELARLSKENSVLLKRIAQFEMTDEFVETRQALTTRNFDVRVNREVKQITLDAVFDAVCQSQSAPKTSVVYNKATGGYGIDDGTNDMVPALNELLLLGLVENQDRISGYGQWVLTSKGASFYSKTRYSVTRDD